MKVNIKVKILTAPRQRTSKFGAPSSSIDVLENRTFVIKTMYIPTTMTPKTPVGSFCLIRNCVVWEFVRATQKSMIMACGPFQFDPKVEEDFLEPAVVTISEAPKPLGNIGVYIRCPNDGNVEEESSPPTRRRGPGIRCETLGGRKWTYHSPLMDRQ
ncbi:uncharacterized protein LOC110459521 isoform X2 [Mizuhopecten yessoensis]|uniref:uncharacterized protein LOC110459521 isoform X2 n=1 Tax=Mizuhopecten yessoensis TaxID=6573 RepID=UPI000B45814A|nr:uncharacterized protein LOC110459521 isoform X2 [Mizuhopecten yessoensis]